MGGQEDCGEYCIVVVPMIEKKNFSKKKDKIDYSKCYKTIPVSCLFLDIISFLNSYNVILDYINLPITCCFIRIRFYKDLKFRSEIGQCSMYCVACAATEQYIPVCVYCMHNYTQCANNE